MEPAKELVCIVCPLGCRMTVAVLEGKEPSVQGASCPRGAEYARREAVAPTRVVPTTVALQGSILKRLPVKTAEPVPKALIARCMEELRQVALTAPVEAGQVVARNLAGTGIAAVATRSAPALVAD